MQELFGNLWWLMCPIFGMVIASLGVAGERERGARMSGRADEERSPANDVR